MIPADSKGDSSAAEPTRQVTAYHGTGQAVAEVVLEKGFIPSVNDGDWLGSGVYFFEGDHGQARQWASTRFPDDPAILEATISLDQCWDLTTEVGWKMLDMGYDWLLKLSRAAKAALPEQHGADHRIDCLVINFVVGALRERGIIVETVRAPFFDGAPPYPHSAFYNRTHIQIAVRELAAIRKVKLFEGTRDVVN